MTQSSVVEQKTRQKKKKRGKVRKKSLTIHHANFNIMAIFKTLKKKKKTLS